MRPRADRLLEQPLSVTKTTRSRIGTFDGTVYLNLSSDPFVFPSRSGIASCWKLQATQPEVLEGEPVYLSLLARAAQKRRREGAKPEGRHPHVRKASRQHARRIAEVFPAAQVDLYGSTEAGYLVRWRGVQG